MNRSSNIVRSGLAATVILALGHYFVQGGWGGVFAFLRQVAAPILTWAGTTVSIPVWLLALVSALTIAIGSAAYIASAKPRKRAPATSPVTKAERSEERR